MEIVLSNIRTFTGMQSVPLRPLTLCVGENSSGKSTFLAMLARVADGSFLSSRPTFNVDPFDLGNYDSIATRRGAKRAESFSLGFSLDESQGGPLRVVATYRNRTGQPHMCDLVVSDRHGTASMEIEGDEVTGSIKLEGAPSARKISGLLPVMPPGVPLGGNFLFYMLSEALFTGHEVAAVRGEGTAAWVAQLAQKINESLMPAFALAPVRTKPRRTYDEISEEFRPEGAHIPLILARSWQKGVEDGQNRLVRELRSFGRSSGLFRNLHIKRLGPNPGDPFQILVTVAGPRANLADVGYGVNQSLPIVVQTVVAAEHRRLLFQQPEVHLHPRAQAALGSLFAKFTAEGEKEFVIETHSDYLLDRVRMEVADSRISADKVMILFFHNKGGRSRIYPITLDRLGNILDAPKAYRRFFIDETVALISRPLDVPNS